MEKRREFWFVVGSQFLYGPEVLETVAKRAAEMAEKLSSVLPYPLVYKVTAKTNQEITDVVKAANYDDNCCGIITWCHTFSPSKMWINGFAQLQKPYCHFATQYNREIPNEEIDMDFMNLNQAAHGDREHGFIAARLRMPRKVIAGYWQDADVQKRIGDWMRAAVGVAVSKELKVMRFGDNMREVAVTEGDKVEVQTKLGWHVNTWPVGKLVEVMDAVTDAEIDALMETYRAEYDFATDDLETVRYRAREEIAVQKMLDQEGCKAFSNTFQDLYGMGISNKAPFGVMPDGTVVDQYTLRAGKLSCSIITYGGALRALRVPDRNGEMVDVVLGFDTLEDYRKQDKYIGALIGRFANRIGESRFTLDGHDYVLANNDGPKNHLHGGAVGFDKQVWNVQSVEENTLTLTLFSPDGQENYPGNLSVQVTYTLSEDGLRIDYRAESDRATPCNLTNHAYFNLAGDSSGPVTDQVIQLFADCYTPADSGSIPTGMIVPVEGTPMDLRKPTVIGTHIDDGFQQLAFAGGYDHNWVVNGKIGSLRPAAWASAPATGITMEVLTTLPGIQFYSGNYLDGCPAGKSGAPYARRWAFCLETQFFPDTPNHANFPDCVAYPGKVWAHTTEFRFATV